jgi:hypothetical protein
MLRQSRRRPGARAVAEKNALCPSQDVATANPELGQPKLPAFLSAGIRPGGPAAPGLALAMAPAFDTPKL